MSETKRRAPTLYAIVGLKLLKGGLFLGMAFAAYTLSDNDLPDAYRQILEFLRLNPERQLFSDLAVKIGALTAANVLWVAAGTGVYSLFSLVEGIGLLLRVSWAGWMAIGESAFFIPIELLELLRHYSTTVFAIFLLNAIIVWYLFANRGRLFRHHAAAPRSGTPQVVSDYLTQMPHQRSASKASWPATHIERR